MFRKGRTADDGSALCSVQCLDPKRLRFSSDYYGLFTSVLAIPGMCVVMHVVYFLLNVLVVWLWCCIDPRKILPSLVYLFITYFAGLHSVLQCCHSHTFIMPIIIYYFMIIYDFLCIHYLYFCLEAVLIVNLVLSMLDTAIFLFLIVSNLFCRTDVTAVCQFSL